MKRTFRIHPNSLARASHGKSRRLQRGVAAVEFAIVLIVLIVLLVLPIFFARVLMHYSVAAKAAQSAAMYMSTIPLQEMQSGARKAAAAGIAKEIAEITVAELRPGGEDAVGVDVQCDTLTCLGTAPPKEVRVVVRMWMFNDFGGDLMAGMVPDGGLYVHYSYTMPYAGD